VRGAERRHLAGELGTDSAAGAGHQHPAAADEALHAGAVEHRLGPTQQILDRHRLDPRVTVAGVSLNWESGSRASGIAQPVRGVEKATQVARRRRGW